MIAQASRVMANVGAKGCSITRASQGRPSLKPELGSEKEKENLANQPQAALMARPELALAKKPKQYASWVCVGVRGWGCARRAAVVGSMPRPAVISTASIMRR